MNHYLITRFNLRTEEWQHTRQGADVLTDNWLEERFRLFENYCLPSVAHQTNNNFTWCVFFDIETPDKFKDRIDGFKIQLKNFHPIYIDNMEHLQNTFLSFIEATMDKHLPYVITTRLDNDDLVHRDFIDTIQNEFILQDNMVIDLTKGYQVNIEMGSCDVRSIDFPFNQFISFVETSKLPLKTVLSKQHQEWKRHPEIRVYNKKEIWIELIHSSNKLNTIRTKFKRTVRLNNAAFGIRRDKYFHDNPIAVIINNFKMDLRKLKGSAQRKWGN